MTTVHRKYARCWGFKKLLLLITTVLCLYLGLQHWSLVPPLRKFAPETTLKQLNSKRVMTSLPQTERKPDVTSPEKKDKNVEDRKCILLYQNVIGHLKKGKDIFNFSMCSVSNCRISTDNSDFDVSKVVIFNDRSIPKGPPKKGRFHWWVYTASESPHGIGSIVKEPQWKNQFDFVLNYRHDSDFFFGYGDIIQKTRGVSKNYDDIYNKKTRDVAWIVSHCGTWSKRELYVNEMKKYIDVDIYGGCGNSKACRSYNGYEDDTCHDMVGTRYKFYLSFENILCKGYTTEKLYFAFAFDKNVIPVVRGATNSKEYLPNDAMIFTEDFNSPKELAYHLKELGSNRTKYIEFLKKKDKYTAKTSPQTLDDAFCSICQKLQSLDESKRKPFDVVDWMMTDTCREPKDLPLNITN